MATIRRPTEMIEIGEERARGVFSGRGVGSRVVAYELSRAAMERGEGVGASPQGGL